jgi:hypothetical protein
MNALMFFTVVCSTMVLDSRLFQAMCGVIMQFLAVSKGLFANGGSVDSTSSPAPAMRF